MRKYKILKGKQDDPAALLQSADGFIELLTKRVTGLEQVLGQNAESGVKKKDFEKLVKEISELNQKLGVILSRMNATIVMQPAQPVLIEDEDAGV